MRRRSQKQICSSVYSQCLGGILLYSKSDLLLLCFTVCLSVCSGLYLCLCVDACKLVNSCISSCLSVFSNECLCLRLRWYGGGFDVQGVQLLDAPSADGHRGVGQSHGGSPPGPAGAAAGGVVLPPLLAWHGGAATGPEADGLRHTQLAVGHLVCELVVL